MHDLTRRATHLRQWLIQVAHLEPEQVAVDVEQGKAQAAFATDALYQPDQSDWDHMHFDQVAEHDALQLTHDYTLTIVIRGFGDNFTHLLVHCLRWLERERQPVTLSYLPQRNNHQTHDLYIDLAIKEQSQLKQGEVQTC